MTGHVRRRKCKDTVKWQVILDRGVDSKGKRIRNYYTIDGNKKKAQAFLNSKLVEYSKGMFVEPSKVTLKEYLNQWLESYAKPNLSPATTRGYRVNINNHIIPYLGDIQVNQLNAMQIQKMINSLHTEKNLAPRTVKYIHSTMREALQHAYKMQLISKNPADMTILPKQHRFKAQPFNEEESIQLLETSKGTDMEVAIFLGLGLGLRRGEILALKWEDVNLESKNVTISRNLIYVDGEYIFKEPKTENSNRKISMPTGLTDVLKRHKKVQLEYKLLFGNTYQDNDLVCCNPNGSPINPGTLSHKFEKFLKKHGFRHIRLHDLRHGNSSLLNMYGVPVKVISERLGHSSTAITLDIYSHIMGNMETEAADKIDLGIFQKLKAMNQ